MSSSTPSLADLSDQLAALAAAAGPSLLRLEAGRAAATAIAWSPDLVVAADHALDDDEGVRAVLPDGTSAEGRLLGRDPRTDLAVARLAGARLAPAAWADLTGTRVGHLALALSRPGRGVRARLGMVAALGPAWRTSSGARVDAWVETDHALHPGFSGSLLLDGAGRALGMLSAGLRRGAALAIPASTVGRVVEAIVAHGHVPRPVLGVGVQPVQVDAGPGLLVSVVQPGSAAADAGLLVGDVLVQVDGARVTHPAELQARLEDAAARVALRVVRAGEVRELTAALGASAP